MILSFSVAAQAQVARGALRQPDVIGKFYGSGQVISAKPADLSYILPPELELAPQSITDTGKHPMLVLAGTQHNVQHAYGKNGDKLVPIPGLVPATYQETIVAVPYVQLKAAHRTPGEYYGPFYYMPALYLDSALAVTLGGLYGYNKHLTKRYDSDGSHTQVYTENKKIPSIDLRMGIERGTFQDAKDVAAFAPMQQMMDMPLIGKKGDGSLVCSLFAWDGAAPIRVAPADSYLSVGLIPSLELDPFPHYSGGYDKQKLGSFRITSHWKLKGPFACKDLPGVMPKPPAPTSMATAPVAAPAAAPTPKH